MDEEEFERRLAELHDRILELPPGERARLLTAEAETRRRHASIRADGAAAREAAAALDQDLDGIRSGLQRLRHAAADLSLRYRMWLFDLEARRREDGWEG